MEKKKKIIVIIVILLIGLPIIIFGLYLLSIEKPSVEIKDIKFVSFDIDEPSITFLVTIDVYNSNDISAILNDLDVDVYIDSQFIGLVNQKIDKEIEAKELTTLELDFVLYNVPIILSRVIDVRITGDAHLTVSMLTFSVPVDELKDVDILTNTNRGSLPMILDDIKVTLVEDNKWCEFMENYEKNGRLIYKKTSK